MLSVKFDVCVINNCTNIQFKDTTGAYDPNYNTGGYGFPNLYPSDGYNRKITITDPSGIVYIVDLEYYDVFDSNDIAIYYNIPNASIGGPTLITDGQWKFVYSFNNFNNTITYTKTIYKYFYCNSEICVANMLADIEIDGCNCNDIDDKLDNYIRTSTFLQSLKYAATCGNLTSFTYIKKIIDKLCKNNNCKTCK